MAFRKLFSVAAAAALVTANTAVGAANAQTVAPVTAPAAEAVEGSELFGTNNTTGIVVALIIATIVLIFATRGGGSDGDGEEPTSP
jgi:hypothetical protein